MTLTIEVAPETESWLQREASHHAVTVEQIAGKMLEEMKAALLANEAQQDREDLDDAHRILSESRPEEWRTLSDLRHELRTAR